jgi:hypothetical protein
MTTIRLDGSPYLFPDNWEEIPPGLRSGILRIVWEFQKRTPQSRLAVLYSLNPVPVKVFKKLVPWQIHELCSLLDWVFEKPIEGRPFDSFEHAGVEYFTPGENFKNTTFAEFLNAYTYFFQLMYDEEIDREEISSKLVATLCRPAPSDMDRAADRVLSHSWSGDFREPFNEHVVDPRSELLADISPGILAGIIQYFLHELRWLYDTYEIFEAASKQASEPDPDESDPDDDENEQEVYDWVATLMDMKDIKYVLVEEKLYLTTQSVMEDNLNNVFDALIRLKERDPKHQPTQPVQHNQEEYD